MRRMVYLIAAISFLCVIIGLGCANAIVPDKAAVITDTVYVHDTIVATDSIKLTKYKAQIKIWRDSVDFLNNRIPVQAYINARKIEKAKYYISICEKNSKNKKFFYGWIKRTIQEN